MEATKHFAETQDSPSQDSGDHKMRLFKHNISPQHYEVNTDDAGSQRSDDFFPPAWPMSLEGSVLTEREAFLKVDYVHDTVVIYKSSNPHNNTEQTAPQQTTRKSPSQICVSSESKPDTATTKKGAGAQQKTPTTEVEMLPSQWEKTHCEKSK